MSDNPATLAIDIGGTRVKAATVVGFGRTVSSLVAPTPRPIPPRALIATVSQLAERLPAFDRSSVGFPGIVRAGRVRDAWRFVADELGNPIPSLASQWNDYNLEAALKEALGGKPLRLVNDADMHGAGAVHGAGLEIMITLGTGFGTALFNNGLRLPHFDLAFHPFRLGETYSEQLGQAALDTVGVEEWTSRLETAIDIFDSVFRYDHLYVGGGNSRLIRRPPGPRTSVVDNAVALLGGPRLWELPFIPGLA